MSGPGTNNGHGHVWNRPDGVKARCGGPGICLDCARDFANWGSHNPQVGKVAEALTKFGFDKGSIIELGFSSFVAACYKDAGPSPDQCRQLRDAFFGGAQHLFASIMTILDPGEEPTAADMQRMDQIHRELEDFAGALARRIYKTEGTPQ